MIGLDTNVIVRYIMQDDPQQAAVAVELVESSLSQARPGFISMIVLVETVWVLKTAYGISKAGLITVIEGLLTSRQLRVEASALVMQALTVFRAGNADFSDALVTVVGTAHGCETWTFDRKAGSVGMRLLRIQTN